MTEAEVKAIVLDVLLEVQSLSGREWNNLDDKSKPIGSLEGFDSLSAVEATAMLEEKLGCTLELDSAFVSEDGNHALTLKEISKRLGILLSSKGRTE